MKLISVSDITTSLECEQKFVYRYVDKRVPIRNTAVALHTGTLWHLACEHKLKGQNGLEVADAQLVAWQKDFFTPPEVVAKIATEWKSLRLLYPHFNPTRLEVVDVECEGRRPHPSNPDITFVGTADAIVRYSGQYWHLQHKTLSSSKPVATYLEYMTTDFHECMYEWIFSQHYRPWGGTILNIARKMSLKTMEKDTRRYLVSAPLMRPPHVVERTIKDLIHYTDDTVEPLLDGYPPIRNRRACAGLYGNSLCPYFDVCFDRAQLSDNSVFTATEPRYKDV